MIGPHSTIFPRFFLSFNTRKAQKHNNYPIPNAVPNKRLNFIYGLLFFSLATGFICLLILFSAFLFPNAMNIREIADFFFISRIETDSPDAEDTQFHWNWNLLNCSAYTSHTIYYTSNIHKPLRIQKKRANISRNLKCVFGYSGGWWNKSKPCSLFTDRCDRIQVNKFFHKHFRFLRFVSFVAGDVCVCVQKPGTPCLMLNIHK